MPLIELRDVAVHYGEIEAVRGISLQVEAGEVVTLGIQGLGEQRQMVVPYKAG